MILNAFESSSKKTKIDVKNFCLDINQYFSSDRVMPFFNAFKVGSLKTLALFGTTHKFSFDMTPIVNSPHWQNITFFINMDSNVIVRLDSMDHILNCRVHNNNTTVEEIVNLKNMMLQFPEKLFLRHIFIESKKEEILQAFKPFRTLEEDRDSVEGVIEDTNGTEVTFVVSEKSVYLNKPPLF